MLQGIANITDEEYGFMESLTETIYSGVRPLTICPLCDYRCNDDAEFKFHMSSQHMSMKIDSQGYFWTFMLSKDKDGHSRINTTPRSYFKTTTAYKCKHCPFMADRPQNMRYHLNKKHNIQVQGNQLLNQATRGLAGLLNNLKAIKEGNRRFVANLTRIEDDVPAYEPRKASAEVTIEDQTHVDDAQQNDHEEDQADAQRSVILINSTQTPEEDIQQVDREEEHTNAQRFVTLINTRNQCYMNAMIQALFHTSRIKQIITDSTTCQDRIFVEVRRIFQMLADNTRQSIHLALISPIFRLLNVSPNIQEDPHEPLLRILSSCPQLRIACNITSSVFRTNSDTSVDQTSTIINLSFPHGSDQQNVDEMSTTTQELFDMNCDPSLVQFTQRDNGGNQSNMVQMIKETADVIVAYIIRQSSVDPSHKDMFKVSINPYIDVLNKTYVIRTAISHRGTSGTSGHYVTYVFEGKECVCLNDNSVETGYFELSEEGIWVNQSPDDSVSIVIYEKTQNQIEAAAPSIDIPEAPDDPSDAIEETPEDRSIRIWSQATQSIIESIADTAAADIPEQEEVTEVAHQVPHNPPNVDADMSGAPVPTFMPIQQAIREAQEFVFTMKDMTEEFNLTQKLTEARSKQFWGSHKELVWDEDFMNVNILALAMVKGTAPQTANTIMCGYPCCPHWFNNERARITHWRKEHSSYNTYNMSWVNTVCNMIGVNIVSRRSKINDGTIDVIECPPLRCPFCDYVGVSHVTLDMHLKNGHKDKFINTQYTISKWLIMNHYWAQAHMDGFTIKNIHHTLVGFALGYRNGYRKKLNFKFIL